MTADQKFKILALDGGGIRGVLSARVLQAIEEQVQKPLNEYFDLITGTSTGSILAAGLALGLNSKTLIQIYQKEGLRIFKPPSWQRSLRQWINQPKYGNEGLMAVLKEYLRHEKFGEIQFKQLPEITKAKLLILAYDTRYRNTTFFISHLPEEQQRWYYDAKLWEICLSSASAPTFFPPYEFHWKDSQNPSSEEWQFPHVDGGVSANNPALAALGHVLGIEKQKLENVAILSVGTGETTEPLEYKEVNSWGLLGWAQQIPTVFMGGQFQLASDVCRQILTSANPKGYLRLQFELNDRFTQANDMCPPKRLGKEAEVNCYTRKKVNEAMDDASPVNIQELLNTTEAFLKSDDYKVVDGKSLSVKESIAQFLHDNP